MVREDIDPGETISEGSLVDLAGSPAACRRIRTLDLFSALEEQVREKGGNAVHYVYCVPKSPYYYSISVPELFPQYEARKGDP